MTPTDTSEKNLGSIVPSAGQEAGYAQGYPDLLAETKQRIRSAQYAALKTVNQELVGLYWDIGRMIVERQAGARRWWNNSPLIYRWSFPAWAVFRPPISGG